MDNKIKPINIMLVVDKLPLGGAEMVVYNLALNLDKDKFKAYICCLEKLGEIGEKIQKQGVEVFELKSRKGLDLFLSFKLARLFKIKDIDIVHAHNSTALRHTVIAAKLVKVAIIIQTRHGDELYQIGKLQKMLQRFLSSQADSIISICEHLKNKIIKNERIDSKKLTVIHNGIDLEKFNNLNLDIKKKKQELGLNEDDFVFINVANIRPEKGQNILIKAFSEVAKENRHTKLMIVGGESDQELARNLKELTNKLGLEKKVIFLGKREDIPEIILASDVFVLSSITEGMPMSILEAMACGKPVIATDVGGIPEVIKNAVTGILVASNSLSELSRAMRILMSDNETSSRLKNQGKIAVEQYFSVQNMVNNYQNLYEKKLPQKKILIVGIIPPPYGGMSIYVNDLLDSELRNKYSLIHFDTSKKTPEKWYWILRLTYQIILLAKLLFVLVTERPALVHLHICSYFSFFRSSLDFIMAKIIFHRKTILHIHGAYFDRFYIQAGGLRKKVISLILKTADKVIVLSSYWEDFLAGIVPKDKISVVQNGIYTDYYKSHYIERMKSAQTRNGRIKFIFLGEIGRRKGVDDILRAISIVKENNNSFCCTFAGNYESEYTKTQIKDFCQKNNIEKYADFVGTVWGDEKYRIFLKSDVFILPSYAENLPIAVLEAMASGLPVVVSKVGAIPEIIKDGVNGFIIEPGDYCALAEKMLFLLKNPDIRIEMGKINSEHARQKYDFKRVAEDLDRVYSGLIEE